MKQNSHTDPDAIYSTIFVIVMDYACFHLLVCQLFEYRKFNSEGKCYSWWEFILEISDFHLGPQKIYILLLFIYSGATEGLTSFYLYKVVTIIHKALISLLNTFDVWHGMTFESYLFSFSNHLYYSATFMFCNQVTLKAKFSNLFWEILNFSEFLTLCQERRHFNHMPHPFS